MLLPSVPLSSWHSLGASKEAPLQEQRAVSSFVILLSLRALLTREPCCTSLTCFSVCVLLGLFQSRLHPWRWVRLMLTVTDTRCGVSECLSDSGIQSRPAGVEGKPWDCVRLWTET